MRVALAVLAVLLATATWATAHPLLVAVVPDLPGADADAIGIGNPGPDPVDLAGAILSDGESSWAVPDVDTAFLAPNGTLWIVGNLTAWTGKQGPLPAIAMVPSLRLAADGDDLALADPDGIVLDAMAYGDKDGADLLPRASPGLVFQRDHSTAGWTDTDGSTDWATPRLHKVGESHLDQPTFMADAVTLYSSPDSSFTTLTDLMGSARDRLHLHVYELRSAELVDAVVAAKARHPSLDLQVLVDGDPVGQSEDERHATADALRRIQAAGGRAVLAGNGRYDDHHLKVLVADDAVAVQSENWVPSGVPVDPSVGNRGWGAVVEGAAMADWFAAWMQADRDGWDVRPFDLASYDPLFVEPPRRAPRTGDYGSIVAPLRIPGPVEVTPLVSPDHTQDPRSDPVASLLDQSTTGIDVQQLDLALTASNRLGWSSADPWTAALAAAEQRGVAVRVLAAAPFSSTDLGNGPELDWLSARGAQAEVLDRPGLTTLHNKAFVIDGEVVVLGSTNGNHHSRSANREVSLVIRSPDGAAWATDLFTSDLDPPKPGRDWGVPGRDLRSIPAALWPTLFALMGVARVLRR